MKKHSILFLISFFILNILTLYFVFINPFTKNKEFQFSKDSIVTKAEIEYTVRGNPLAKVNLTELNDKDTKINTVATNMGFTFDISGNFSNFQLKNAEVTLKYNKEKLAEDYDVKKLGILWYDEENQKMEIIKSKVNAKKNTITFTTNHFSQYVLVDLSEWNAIWEKELTKVRTGEETFNVSLIVDDSGSMFTNDKKNQRVVAARETIAMLTKNDLFSIIQFSDSAKVILDFTKETDNVENALKKFRSSGGTNIVDAVTKGIDKLSELKNNGTNIIFLLTDGEDSNLKTQKDALIERAKKEKIIIFGIGLQSTNSTSNTNFTPIQELAEETGGKFYSIKNTEIQYIFDYVRNTTIGIDPSIDSDHDGLPDGLEEAGFRDAFGIIHVTSPTNKDTDGDGASDKDEVGKLINNSYYELFSDPNDSNIKPYHLGPEDEEKNEVYDSGFRPNINALQIKNLKVKAGDKTEYDGLCAGFALLTEKVYNGTLTKENGVYGYSLKAENFERIIKNKTLYQYTPDSNILKKPTKEEDYKIVTFTDENAESDADVQMINEIINEWSEYNSKTNLITTLHGNQYVSERTITQLKNIFQSGKIISVSFSELYFQSPINKEEAKLQSISASSKHAINAYALEKMSKTEYRLYVYDNNFPYNPYLHNVYAGFSNNYITLKKTWTGEYEFEYAPTRNEQNKKAMYSTGLLTGIAFYKDNQRIDND